MDCGLRPVVGYSANELLQRRPGQVQGVLGVVGKRVGCQIFDGGRVVAEGVVAGFGQLALNLADVPGCHEDLHDLLQ